MRIRLIAITGGLAAFVPLAAFAADPAPVAQPVSTASQPNPVVCHYFYHEGFVIKRPDCRPQHEWDRRRLEEQRYIREFQLRSFTQE
jgi:hypothetical protein